MNIKLNKDKSIGKVLYIVEGGKTEPYILHRLFSKLFDYQVEMIIRDKGYHKYNSKENPTSQVFVINAQESNIKNIHKDNEFLNNLFRELIENYDFDIDNSAMFYLFDRDNRSNTDSEMIKGLITSLSNSRENENYLRQGLLLLSYPSIESFTLSNFQTDCFTNKFKTGDELKIFLHKGNINHQNISEETLVSATEELLNAFRLMNIDSYDIDNFGSCNMDIFNYEESAFAKEQLYRALSLVCISLIDLGLIEII
ncbi:MAG: hypothetical protein IJP38_10315 [Oscillospiraceae bacterium]|nr:hypothetical protein [Oscillospiraceae bacterium]